MTDRELIDAAIAAGKVQVIPRGVSGKADDDARLRRTSPMAAKQRKLAEKRRPKVAKLWDDGFNVAAIAERLRVSDHAIRNDLRVLGLVTYDGSFKR
jgi:DNA-binding NarL/FixJ family response regulator